MANFPSSIFSPRERENKSGVVYDVDKKTVIYVEDQNKGDDEVVAIENFLGLPAGQAGKYLIINATEDGIDFGDVDLSGKANVALDNLSGVALNVSLVSATDSAIDLGSSTKFFANAYIDKVYFEADAFLEYQRLGGNDYIAGQSNSSGVLAFLAKNDSIALKTTKSGSTYGITLIANLTHGITLYAEKAGQYGHFVIAPGHNIYPGADSSNDLGSSTLFFANVYTDLLHLSSTINLDGSETGILKINAADIRPDSDSARDLGAGNVTAKDQSEEGAGNQTRGWKTTWQKGQSFTTGIDITNVSVIEMFLRKEGASSETIFMDIYAEDGSGKPTGASLGQTSVPGITNTSFEWIAFTFSTPVTVSALTKYVLVISSPDTTDWNSAHALTTDPYAGGSAVDSSDSGGSWTVASGVDYKFKTFTDSDFYWKATYTKKLFLNATATLDGAIAGQITAVGDLVFSGSGSGLPFGEINVVSNSTETAIASQDVYVQITIFDTNGESNLVTPDHTNDHITIVKAGRYLITCSITLNSIGGAGSTAEIEVKKNNGNVRVGSLHVDRTLAGGGAESGAITISGIVNLAVDDTIEVWIKNETNTQNYIVEDITLSLVQIGG